MITADEARKLCGVSAIDMMKTIDRLIRQAATPTKEGQLGQTEIVLRDEPFANWMDPRYTMNEAEKVVVNTLIQNGFVVSFWYHEGQFVDSGLWIKW